MFLTQSGCKSSRSAHAFDETEDDWPCFHWKITQFHTIYKIYKYHFWSRSVLKFPVTSGFLLSFSKEPHCSFWWLFSQPLSGVHKVWIQSLYIFILYNITEKPTDLTILFGIRPYNTILMVEMVALSILHVW